MHAITLFPECVFHQARKMNICKVVFPVNRLDIVEKLLILSIGTLSNYAKQLSITSRHGCQH